MEYWVLSVLKVYTWEQIFDTVDQWNLTLIGLQVFIEAYDLA